MGERPKDNRVAGPEIRKGGNEGPKDRESRRIEGALSILGNVSGEGRQVVG